MPSGGFLKTCLSCRFVQEQQQKDIEDEKSKLEDARKHVSYLKKELVRMSNEVTAMQVCPCFLFHEFYHLELS